MAYRISMSDLSCADRVRLDMATKDTGLDGSDLVMSLVRSFLDSRGVKNPYGRSIFSKKNHYARKV